MSLIIAENVTQVFGTREVLKDVSVRVGRDDRIGLVGPNGEGKTTLLRIIGGLLEPTRGSVHRSRGVRIGYLPQDPPAFEDKTIEQACLDVFADIRGMEEELQAIAAQMSSGAAGPEILKRYGALQAEFEARGGYSYQRRMDQVLGGLGFKRDMWPRSLGQLSGGQRTLVYLATLLLAEPDVLLLDEPTNHLDLDAIEWLESWLEAFKGAIVVVSHDRYFLDHMTRTTWEVAFGGVETYRAGYGGYLRQRAERHKERMRVWEAQQEYIDKTQEFIRIHIAGQRSKEARGRRTRLERFMRDEAVDRPKEHARIHLTLRPGKRTGDIVLVAVQLAVGYDALRPIVTAESLEVYRDDRIAIVGANGVGKTTLLRTLLGELEPTGGAVQFGANVSIGYLSQGQEQLDPQMTVLDAVQSARSGITVEFARSLLGSLLFTGNDVVKRVGDLSGGERSRVALARLVVSGPNVLMLDEPTNHLDIPSTEIIENVLKSFDGTVIFVSHDRFLIEAVATKVWPILDGEARCVLGGWEDYVKWRDERAASAAAPRAGESVRREKERVREDYRQARREANALKRLRRRHEELETQIESAEDDLKMLSEGITAAGESGNVALVEELGKKYKEVDGRLKDLWREWEALSEELQ